MLRATKDWVHKWHLIFWIPFYCWLDSSIDLLWLSSSIVLANNRCSQTYMLLRLSFFMLLLDELCYQLFKLIFLWSSTSTSGAFAFCLVVSTQIVSAQKWAGWKHAVSCSIYVYVYQVEMEHISSHVAMIGRRQIDEKWCYVNWNIIKKLEHFLPLSIHIAENLIPKFF